MLLLNNVSSWLRIRLRDPAVSWMEVSVARAGGFQLLVVTMELVLDVVQVLYLLLFTHAC